MTDGKNTLLLSELAPNARAEIVGVGGEGALRQHILDMGVIPGASIEFVKRAPMGDPLEFRIHGYELTLREADAAQVRVGLLSGEESARGDGALPPADEEAEHPGLGEGGRFHSRADEHPLPDDAVLTFALASNQNCGKTTLFNQLTGSNQRVGNFPGVTVDRKEGPIKGHANTNVVDLPGIYSMSRAVVKPHESKEHARSAAIDKLLTGRFTAIPMFIVIMAAIFLLTFNVFGPFFQDLIQTCIDWLTEATEEGLDSWGASPLLTSFVIDGVYNGVGTVLLFFPIIVIMFFFLSLLQDTGYMARVAFFMDRSLRRIGLSGRSIVPMIMGFGCSVPAIMATRTLPSERDRKLTVLLTPFMSCATKLTIYGFVAEAFFPDIAGWVMIGLYLLGIVLAIGVGAICHRSIFKGEAVPFVMELPNYRMPSAKSVGRLVWDKSKDFITRAFTVIFVATIIVWFLQSFSPQLVLLGEEESESSILALIAGWMSPLFAPLGFGEWQFVTALIAGFMAKETVVSTLSVLFDGTAALATALSPAAALAFLVFCLLYTPCVAAVAAIKRELGGKWAFGIVVLQCAIAWVVAWVVYMVALLFVPML